MLCRFATGSLARAAVVVVEQPVMPPTPRAMAETMARSLVFMMWIPLRVFASPWEHPSSGRTGDDTWHWIDPPSPTQADDAGWRRRSKPLRSPVRAPRAGLRTSPAAALRARSARRSRDARNADAARAG